MAECDRLHLDLPGCVLHGDVAFVWKHRFPPLLCDELCATIAPKCASRVAQAQVHFLSHLASHHRSAWRGSPLPTSVSWGHAGQGKPARAQAPDQEGKKALDAPCKGPLSLFLPLG